MDGLGQISYIAHVINYDLSLRIMIISEHCGDIVVSVTC